MPHPGDSPDPADVAHRWAAHLIDTHAGNPGPLAPSDVDGAPHERVTVDRDTLEQVLLSVAREADGHARRAADAATRRFTDLYSVSPVGMVLCDPDGVIRDVNPALTHLLGFGAADLEGRPLSALAASDADAATLADAVERLALPARRPRRERLTVRHARDEPRRVRVTVTALTGDTEGSDHPVLLVEDLSEFDLLSETLRKQNTRDPLTGLPNSYHFDNQIDTTLGAGEAARIALVYLDIDGFRVVNDGLGPGAGNYVLQHVARKLERQFAVHDPVVARLSGDGFAVLMRGEFTSAEIIDLVEDATAELAEPVYVDGTGVGVGVSVGIVVTRPSGRTREDLQRAAEITLHRAKENGKAQWMLFESDLDEQDRRRYAIGAGIGGGLENGEFTVHYEPTVTFHDDRVAVVNAVLRWNHPEYGLLGPDEFGALADTTGMTAALGDFLLTRAMTDAAAWHDEFDTAPDLCVRLPTRFAIDPNLVRMVRTRLRETGMPAGRLRICTDSAAVSDPRGEVLETLSVLADLDVKVTLAVAGTADLDLVRTHHLPVGFVILCGPLVDALGADTDAAARAQRHVSALLDQAASLGIGRVGADGVHTAEQAERLRALGVVAGRGKQFGEEVDIDGLRALLSGPGHDARS
ncbi:EAL domain-containing protein [Saccharomonospora saliphila]|uniref:EAL domain-containing protein n=1 Tax=Saccharomonospora saliphila TaxID=369829 RepID=UPI00035DED23|nr:EAL domain-containing protein [Saccharomonospora saliphila]